VSSRVLASLDVEVALEVLDRRAGWAQVRLGGLKGWVRIGTDSLADRVPEGEILRFADEARLALALEVLGSEEPIEAGRFDLYTDVEDDARRRSYVDVASQIGDAFVARFGVDPDPRGAGAVVVYSREADYRRFETLTRAGVDLRSQGHTWPGQAVLFVSDLPPADVIAVLVHELCHLLLRGVSPTVLPPWMEEGLANDLAFSRVDDSGRLVLGSLGGRRIVFQHPMFRVGLRSVDREVRLQGAVASLSLLRESWLADRAPSLKELTSLDAQEFFHPDDRLLHYDESSFLVRFLLDERSDRFRRFLSFVAAGGDPSAVNLLDYLDSDWTTTGRAFERWLVFHPALP